MGLLLEEQWLELGVDQGHPLAWQHQQLLPPLGHLWRDLGPRQKEDRQWLGFHWKLSQSVGQTGLEALWLD